jgi:2,4-dienoyl-CoA reductase (NADPH2)
VFAREWGIDFRNHPRGGVTGVEPVVARNDREVTLMQRKATTVGKGLGRTTGWTHRLHASAPVRQHGRRRRIPAHDDAGLHTLVEGQRCCSMSIP